MKWLEEAISSNRGAEEMETWAPWRIEYILGKKPAGCIFCDKPREDKDEENLILLRGKITS